MDKKRLIQLYGDALQEGRAAVFAGAGLSVSAGYVDWAGLLKGVAGDLGVTIDEHTDLVNLAQYHVNKYRSSHALSTAILNSFPDYADPTDNHRILAGLPIDVYWTTNFDKLIERSLEKAGKVFDVKSDPAHLAISKKERQVTVYKMHGDMDHPEKAILTRDHFEQYPYTHQAFLNNFSFDLSNRTFLFLGLSFEDPNLAYVLRYVRHLYHDNQRSHYYVLKRVTRKPGESDAAFRNRETLQGLFVEDLKNYGIQTLLIDDYREITELLTGIREKYCRKTVFVSGAAADYAPYDVDRFRQFVRDLSGDMVRKGFRIVTGYGLGLGNEVLAGAIAALNSLHKPIDGNLFIRPFPQNVTDPDAVYASYRTEMISRTGVSLFLMGNKTDRATGKRTDSPGVREEYEISRNNGNFLIPVGATGSMARKLYDAQMAEIRAGGTRYDAYEGLFRDVGDETLTLDKLREKILDLLDAINQ